MSIPGSASPLFFQTAAAADSVGYQIKKSVRFNDGDYARLNRTPSSAGNRRTWTFSVWIKRCALGSPNKHIFDTTGSPEYSGLYMTTANRLEFRGYTSGFNWRLETSQVFRDPAAWLHIVVNYNSTASTSTDRLAMYINGSKVTSFTNTQYPSQNQDSNWNNNVAHYLGAFGTTNVWDGYMADIHNIDGQALAASDFGEYDNNGVWRPKEYTGTFGTNGFHLFDFANESSVGHDSSGNENDWSPVNISTNAGEGNDVLFDTPTNGDSSDDSGAGGEVSGNYPTWNPIDNGGSLTLGNGNLQAGNTGTAHNACRATVKFPSTGKWYYEGEIHDLGGACCIGVDNSGAANPALATSGTFYILVNSGGSVQKYNGGSVTNVSGMGTPAQGGFLQVAYDADADKLWLGLNNNWMGSGSSANGNPGAGTEASISSVTDPFPATNLYTSNVVANFGQRSFNYSAPTDFKPLCTALFPTATVPDGSTAFDVKTWTGNGTSQTLSGLNMSPDLVWVKARSFTGSPEIYDSVRGASKRLYTSLTNAESSPSTSVNSFTSDGFSVTGGGGVNNNNATYVGWAWDAGSSTVSNTDGSITSSVRASQTNGFSIVSFTGNGTAGATIGHGLSAAPEAVFYKNRDRSENWGFYSKAVGASKSMYLPSGTKALTANTGSANMYNSTHPSASVLTVGGAPHTNANGEDIIAYCFTPVAGYSAMGAFSGYVSGAKRRFVYTGFLPRVIIIKSYSHSVDWAILDTERSPINIMKHLLYLNLDDSEVSSDNQLSVRSNGFFLDSTSTTINSNGVSYIYLAFAESPFSSNGGLAR